jgi:phage terminase large subunit-like protein
VRSCGLFVDEVHEAAQLRDFNNVADQARKGGSNAGPEFLEVNISTSPMRVASGFYLKMIQQARKQRDQGGDETLLPLLYQFPIAERPELDISDSSQWWRAIPSIGHTQPLDEIEREFKLAVASPDPADLSLFMSQRLCIEPDDRKGVDRWSVVERWGDLPRCGRWHIDPAATKPTVGIDIGGSDDLAGLVLIYTVGDAMFVLTRQYCTKAAFDRAHPNARQVYQQALDADELRVLQTGAELETAIQMEVARLSAVFGSDLWAGGDGLGLAGFGQRFTGATGVQFRSVKQSFNLLAPKNRLEVLVADGMVHHEHTPLLRWNLGNVLIDESGGGIKLRKADAGASGQGSAKIDAVMALLSGIELLEHPDRTTWDVGALIA